MTTFNSFPFIFVPLVGLVFSENCNGFFIFVCSKN